MTAYRHPLGLTGLDFEVPSLDPSSMARAEGAAAERAAVVAYLRRFHSLDDITGPELADEFERGEHVRPPPAFPVSIPRTKGAGPACWGEVRHDVTAEPCDRQAGDVAVALAVASVWGAALYRAFKAGVFWPGGCGPCVPRVCANRNGDQPIMPGEGLLPLVWWGCT